MGRKGGEALVFMYNSNETKVGIIESLSKSNSEDIWVIKKNTLVELYFPNTKDLSAASQGNLRGSFLEAFFMYSEW